MSLVCLHSHRAAFRMLAAVACAFSCAAGAWAEGPIIAESPPSIPLPAFTLTDQEGNPFGSDALEGKVAVVYFFFSSCTGPCPVLNANVAKLSQAFAGRDDLLFVGLSVDPETDTPERLAAFGKKYGADPAQWRFLTGDIEEVNRVARALRVQAADQPIFHSTRLILVDQEGQVRDYFPGVDDAGVAGLESAISGLLGIGPAGAGQSSLPTVNALLNAIAACFLLAGFLAIKSYEDPVLHRKMMVGALVASAAFLVSYVIYHAQHGSVSYQREGLLWVLYMAILVPHIILAAVMAPFILLAVYFALRGQFERHTMITWWLWPVWMYVSVTGVAIYLMLYHL